MKSSQWAILKSRRKDEEGFSELQGAGSIFLAVRSHCYEGKLLGAGWEDAEVGEDHRCDIAAGYDSYRQTNPGCKHLTINLVKYNLCKYKVYVHTHTYTYRQICTYKHIHIYMYILYNKIGAFMLNMCIYTHGLPRWHSVLRIHLPRQETRLWSLGPEDPLE